MRQNQELPCGSQSRGFYFQVFSGLRCLQVNGAHENETILASDRMMEALVALQSFDPGTFQNKSFQW